MGSVTTWFYQGLAGIKKTSAGYRTFDVKPYIPENMDDLSAKIDTLFGNIEFSWKRKGENISFEIVVPFGTQAQFYLPLGKTIVNGQAIKDNCIILGSGKYNFVVC
jgi:alpha-L-rhamnosidase